MLFQDIGVCRSESFLRFQSKMSAAWARTIAPAIIFDAAGGDYTEIWPCGVNEIATNESSEVHNKIASASFPHMISICQFRVATSAYCELMVTSTQYQKQNSGNCNMIDADRARSETIVDDVIIAGGDTIATNSLDLLLDDLRSYPHTAFPRPLTASVPPIVPCRGTIMWASFYLALLEMVVRTSSCGRPH